MPPEEAPVPEVPVEPDVDEPPLAPVPEEVEPESPLPDVVFEPEAPVPDELEPEAPPEVVEPEAPEDAPVPDVPEPEEFVPEEPELEPLEPEVFEPEPFEPVAFEPDALEADGFELEVSEFESFEPEVVEPDAPFLLEAAEPDDLLGFFVVDEVPSLVPLFAPEDAAGAGVVVAGAEVCANATEAIIGSTAHAPRARIFFMWIS